MTKQREIMQNRLINSMAGVFREDQYEAGKKFLEDLDEVQFWQLIAEIQSKSAGEETSLKEFYNISEKLRKMNGVNADNTPMRNLPARIMEQTEVDELWELLKETNPSDVIMLTGAEDKELIHLWEDTRVEDIRSVSIPSDLFFADTIPMMDCRIVVDERNTEPNGQVVEYRVAVLPDYADRIEAAGEDAALVGAVVETINNRSLIIPFYVIKGVDSVLGGQLGLHGLNEMNRRAAEEFTRADISGMFIGFMETWYGIQIALLHPTVQDVFRHPARVKEKLKKDSKGVKKRPVKYIKKHVINKDELEKAMYGDSGRKNARHTLVWYVIGHWRTLASGAKTFVSPCWKGPLRELKMAQDGAILKK